MESGVNERVKVLRSFLNLTQTEFASRINSTFATISRIENGSNEPRRSTLVTICRVFNVSEEWLINGKGEMLLPGQEITKGEPSNWKEEAYIQLKSHNETLKQEVEWLKNLVTKLTGSVNFPNGIDTAGMFLNPVNSVRAVA